MHAWYPRAVLEQKERLTCCIPEGLQYVATASKHSCKCLLSCNRGGRAFSSELWVASPTANLCTNSRRRAIFSVIPQKPRSETSLMKRMRSSCAKVTWYLKARAITVSLHGSWLSQTRTPKLCPTNIAGYVTINQ